MERPPKPLLVFDGDCGFCRAWIARWRRLTGDRVDYAPYQEAAERFPEIARERFAEAVHLIEPDGRWSRGAEAVYRSLARAPRQDFWLWLYERLPGFGWASEAAYRVVARQRPLASRLTAVIWGPHVVPPGDRLTAWIFLRALGLVYAVAFLSLWVQVIGLVGPEGIAPAGEYLAAARQRFGPAAYWHFPTLCWLGSGDGALHALCGAGALLGALVLAGIAPAPALALLWALYLSLATVGQDFLWFQWDGLLLETGFLAVFLAPWRRWSRPASDPDPPRAALWLLRWLLLRFMLSSAAVKLLSGDPTWRSLTALEYHYETQPLPPWTAWYAHQLPAWAHRATAAAMFALEGIVPFFFLAPRRIRFAAAAAIAGLQGVLLVTGNYGFFNLLSLALCVPLLDDGVWPRGRRLLGAPPDPEAPARGRWPGWIAGPVLGSVLVLSLVPLFGALRWNPNLLGPIVPLYQLAAPFRAVNSYGLFAIMTTERPEIVVEGSSDGLEWRPYRFRWKPCDPQRRPAFVTPHMPRLDWQMWFAALSDARRETWFLRFCERLLRGSRPVLSLLAANPFLGTAPRFVRAVVWDYRFTDPTERRASGAWWKREPKGLYVPVLTLEGGRLVAARDSLSR